MRIPLGRLTLYLTCVACLVGCGGKPAESVSVSSEAIEAIRSADDVVAAQGDWPWWRGPSQNGRADEQTIPSTWDESTNVQWKVALPGRGHASPVVVGDRIYIATADESKETMSLIALDRATGDTVWSKELHRGGFANIHNKNTHASQTPAWDGTNVIVPLLVDGAIFVSAVSAEGEISWQVKAGEFSSRFGYGSSPVLYKSLVIIAGDSDRGSFIAGLDRASGKVMWRTPRPINSSYCTPVIAELDGKTQLIISGDRQVNSYDPADGQPLWESEGPAKTTANTLAWNDELVFVGGGYPEKGIWAIKADGTGKVVWQEEVKVYVPSPVVVGDRLLVTSDEKKIWLYKANSGEEIWTHRTKGAFSASPMIVGNLAYLPDERGSVLVFRTDTDEFELVGENELDSGMLASPVACGGQLFLRSEKSLYCIGEKK